MMRRILFALLLLPQLTFASGVCDNTQSTMSINISSATTLSTNSSISTDINILSGGTLTIKATTTLLYESKIIVYSNGVLIVDGGTIQYANIELQPGSQLIVRNAGTINMLSGTNFTVPAGANASIESGTVN